MKSPGISSLPIHQHNGIEPCNHPPQGIFRLKKKSLHLNHLERIHASSIFALAEASSGQFLVDHLSEWPIHDFVISMRFADIDYRSSTDEDIYSIGNYLANDWNKLHRALHKNGRGLIRIPIQIMNNSGKCVATSGFQWYLFRRPKRREGNQSPSAMISLAPGFSKQRFFSENQNDV